MSNFYSNKLYVKRYLKILINFKKDFPKKFLIQNTGLFIGDKAFYKILKNFEILKEVKNVKGEIIEFGVWNGNNLITMKKILDYLNINKTVIGYDNFNGMPKSDHGNRFIGNKKLIKFIIGFFKLKRINILEDDIMNLKNNLKKIPKLSLIYIDCDLYNTTKIILDLLTKKLSKGGLVVFDEANLGQGEEGKAAQEFFKKNKRKFKEIILKKFYQPDYILKKIN